MYIADFWSKNQGHPVLRRAPYATCCFWRSWTPTGPMPRRQIKSEGCSELRVVPRGGTLNLSEGSWRVLVLNSDPSCLCFGLDS